MKTTSLELSRKLYEAGIKLDTEKYWEHLTEMVSASGVAECDHWRLWTGAYRTGFIPAPTTDELFELLPKGTRVTKTGASGFRSEVPIHKRLAKSHYATTVRESLGLLALSLREKKII